MSPKINPVKLTLKDLKHCIALDRISLNGIWNKQQWEEELINPNGLCIGIIKNSKLIGLCCGWIMIDEINITLLAIHPLNKRQGFGKILLSYFINLANNINVKIITLETKENNIPAQALFRSLKFRELAKRNKLYSDGSNAIVFQLKITEES